MQQRVSTQGGHVAIDQARIGEVVAQLIGQLQETFGEDESIEVDTGDALVSVKHGLFDGTHVPLWHNSLGLPIHEAPGLLRCVQIEVEDYMRAQPNGEATE